MQRIGTCIPPRCYTHSTVNTPSSFPRYFLHTVLLPWLLQGMGLERVLGLGLGQQRGVEWACVVTHPLSPAASRGATP